MVFVLYPVMMGDGLSHGVLVFADFRATADSTAAEEYEDDFF
jgi:hypothetical protein